MYDTPGKCLPRLYEQALAGQQTATGFAASCPQYRTDINRDFAFEIMNKPLFSFSVSLEVKVKMPLSNKELTVGSSKGNSRTLRLCKTNSRSKAFSEKSKVETVFSM